MMRTLRPSNYLKLIYCIQGRSATIYLPSLPEYLPLLTNRRDMWLLQALLTYQCGWKYIPV